MNRRFRLRALYYLKKLIRFFGFCPHCWSVLNYTITGRALCPNCKRR